MTTSHRSPRAVAADEDGARAPRTAPVDAALIATICASVIAHELLIARSGFFLDDFRNLADARRLGLSGTLLTEPMFEHFAPGHRLMDWLAAEPLGRDFRFASALEAGWVALALGALAALLRTVWGRRLWHVLPLVAVGLSWPLVATNHWFAAGAHVTPALALTMLSVALAARWGATGRIVPAIASVAAGFCAVLFWVQAVVAPLLATVVLVALVDGAASPRETVASLRRRLPYVALHAAAIGAFLLWLVTRPWRPDLGHAGIDDVVVLLRVVALRGVIPSLLGRGLPSEGLSATDAAWQSAAVLVCLAIFAFSIATRRRWAAGVILIASMYIAIVAMLAAGRLAHAGPMIGNEPRYVAFLVPAVVLGIATMFQPTDRTRPLRSRQLVRWLGPGLAVAFLTILVLNVQRSADRSYWRANGLAGKAAGARLGAQLAQLSPADGTRLVDSELPPPFFYPRERGDDNTLERLVPYFSARLHPLGDASNGPLLRADGAALTPVSFRRRASPIVFDCTPSTPCTRDVGVRRPIPSGAYVQIRAQDPALASLTIAPVDGAPTKDDPREVARAGRPAGSLTGPVWASDTTRARISVSVRAPTRIRAELGILVPLRR